MIPEKIYVDSSAFYALLDRADTYHQPARTAWPALLQDDVAMVTTNYVVSETMTVLQFRIGFEAADLWRRDILGVLDMYWVDKVLHRQACDLWMNLGRRRYSLVDCVSFVAMRQNRIEKAFAFKTNYLAQGIELFPAVSVGAEAEEGTGVTTTGIFLPRGPVVP
jgi:predicted nucleic acid-binding protein